MNNTQIWLKEIISDLSPPQLYGERELYDLQSDLSESTNVAEANPEVVTRLTSLINKHIADGRSTPGAQQKNDAPLSVDNPSPAKKKKARKEQ